MADPSSSLLVVMLLSLFMKGELQNVTLQKLIILSHQFHSACSDLWRDLWFHAVLFLK